MDNRISRNTPPPAPSPSAARAHSPNRPTGKAPLHPLCERDDHAVAGAAVGSVRESSTQDASSGLSGQRRPDPDSDQRETASRQVRARTDRDRVLQTMMLPPPQMMPPAPLPPGGIEQWRVLAQFQAWAQESHAPPHMATGPQSPRSEVMAVESASPVPRNAALIQQWRAWAEQPPSCPEEQRSEAMRRVVACCEGSENQATSLELDLSRLMLIGVLPSLPGHLKRVNISENKQLTALSPFPEACELQALDVSGNEMLRALPPIPSSLQKLDAAHCNLEQLPPFPADCQLKTLILRSNLSLATLPTLPPSLAELDVRNCSIERPPSFPPRQSTS